MAEKRTRRSFTREFKAQAAVVHGSGTWAQSPHPRLDSCDADVARASQLQHAVQGAPSS
jgi:hypothetical protein